MEKADFGRNDATGVADLPAADNRILKDLHSHAVVRPLPVIPLLMSIPHSMPVSNTLTLRSTIS